MYLDPTDESALHLFGRDIDGPFTMLNLLRFREVADYSESPHLEPTRPISGRDAYDHYVRHTVPFLRAAGGTIDMFGQGGHFFVGPPDERWDLVMMIRQAGVESFVAFASDRDYLRGLGHRTAAVEDSRLLPIVDVPLP